jgi:hypothetical protein
MGQGQRETEVGSWELGVGSWEFVGPARATVGENGMLIGRLA